MPIARRKSLTQPASDSICCQMRTPATNGTTYGRKNSTRNADVPMRCRELTSIATKNGRSMKTGSAMSANLNVTSSDAWVWWSVSSWA